MGTHCVVEVFNGELGEALVNQVRFAFSGNRFEPEETKVEVLLRTVIIQYCLS